MVYMENANVNVKRIDIMLFKEFKNIVKKDENVATVPYTRQGNELFYFLSIQGYGRPNF